MTKIPRAAPPESISLFRFAVVSEVRARVLGGATLAAAVRATADHAHPSEAGEVTVGLRSVYRWYAAFERSGFQSLRPVARDRTSASLVLDDEFLAFVQNTKTEDPKASIPEIIRRAVAANLIDDVTDVDRSTVWRALSRLGADTRIVAPQTPDQRRFAYPHRLQMVLVDGKHFRAGPNGARRVACIFIDDASRYVPYAVVGTSETSQLYLRGLHGLLERVGKFDSQYFDNGSAFNAHDSHAVLAALDLGWVHGTAGYPQGRGKIERFNRTILADLLRQFARDGVDPDCRALELRLETYLRDEYNRRPHGSLDGVTPEKRFLDDERALSPVPSDVVRRAFFVEVRRHVSNDHVVSVDGESWEVPRGLGGSTVVIRRDVLDPSHLRLTHAGHDLRLHRVDTVANARSRRRPRTTAPAATPPVASSAHLAADRALAPITQPDGGFPADPTTEAPPWI
ncbi:MAG: integrase core domain-containing protein [Rhodospirillales bacterium]